MSLFDVSAAPTWLSVVSVNAPFGSGVVSVRIAVETEVALEQSGMLSPVTVFTAPAETFLTFQSAALNATARQTALLNDTVMTLFVAVKPVKTGLVVSWYRYGSVFDAAEPELGTATVATPAAAAGGIGASLL